MRRRDQLDAGSTSLGGVLSNKASQLNAELSRQFELELKRLQRLQAELGIDHRDWYRRILEGNIVAGEATIAQHEATAKSLEFTAEIFRSLPGGSDLSDINEIITGKDLLTGEELSKFDYAVTVVGAVIPFAGSSSLRKFFKGVTDGAAEGVAKGIDATQHASKRAVCGGSEAGNALRKKAGLREVVCFAPDTPVQTPSGPRRIDEIEVGDLVRAFDFDAGDWVDRPVEATHHNEYNGPLVSITTETGTIRATVYHPIWVVEGRDLTERPWPRNLPEGESEGKSLAGRWVNSHDLRPGDVLSSHDGSRKVVLKTEQEHKGHFPICNLTVAINHMRGTGRGQALVHLVGAWASERGLRLVNGLLRASRTRSKRSRTC